MVAEIRELLWWVRLCGRGGTIGFLPPSAQVTEIMGQVSCSWELLQGALQVDERWSSCFIQGRKSQDCIKGQLSASVASFTIFIDRAPPRGWEGMDAFALSSQQSSPLVVTLYSWVSTRRSYDGSAKSLNLHAIKHHSTISKTVTMLHRLLPFKLTRQTHSASSVVSRYSDLTTADGAGRQSHLQSVELYF